MKKLIYQIEGYTEVYNPETGDVAQKMSLADVCIENPSNEDITLAAQIAYNGSYEVDDDGVEETSKPTQEERITELEEALDLLLSGVTE